MLVRHRTLPVLLCLCLDSQENEKLQLSVKRQKTEIAKLQAACEQQVVCVCVCEEKG